jgi:hypothetical protein
MSLQLRNEREEIINDRDYLPWKKDLESTAYRMSASKYMGRPHPSRLTRSPFGEKVSRHLVKCVNLDIGGESSHRNRLRTDNSTYDDFSYSSGTLYVSTREGRIGLEIDEDFIRICGWPDKFLVNNECELKALNSGSVDEYKLYVLHLSEFDELYEESIDKIRQKCINAEINLKNEAKKYSDLIAELPPVGWR